MALPSKDEKIELARLKSEVAKAEKEAARAEFELRCAQAAHCDLDFESLSPGDQARFGRLYDEYAARDDDPVAAGFMVAVDESLRLRAEAIESGKSKEEARQMFRRHLSANAPCDYGEFKKRSRANILTFAKAHFPPGRTASSGRRLGRASRPSTNLRARGSRRTLSTGSGGGRSDDPDLSEPPDGEGRPVSGRSAAEHPKAPDDSAGPRSPLPGGSTTHSNRRVTNCRGCGEPIAPERRSDAEFCPGSTCRMARKKMDADAPPKWTDSQHIEQLQKRRAKILRAAPVADLPEAVSATTVGVKQCRGKDLDRHPEHIADVAERVRHAATRKEAAAILRGWLSRCFHDRRYGDLTCRNCGRTVAQRDFRPASFWVAVGDDQEDLWLEMTTDGHGQSLYPSASSGRAI